MVRLGVQCSVLPMRSHPLIFDREILDVFMGSVVESRGKSAGTTGDDFFDLESLSKAKN